MFTKENGKDRGLIDTNCGDGGVMKKDLATQYAG
jgi:hypothetical protein